MITPDEVLATAEALSRTLGKLIGKVTPGEFEGLLRATTSRFYYAAFSRAEEVARSHGWSPIFGIGSHDSLWGWYGDRGFDGLEAKVLRPKAWRTIADYRLDRTIRWTAGEAAWMTYGILGEIARADEALSA